MEKIVASIIRRGNEKPDHEALVADDQSIAYGELANRILNTAEMLRQQGIVPGDKVLLSAIPQPVYVYLYFALHLLNAIAVPLEKSVTRERVQSLSDLVRPRMIFVGGEMEGCVDMTSLTLPQKSYCYTEKELSADDTVSDILFTTGTTGQSKGVVLTHTGIIAGAQNVIEGGEMRDTDRNLLPVPLYHAYGLTTLRAILYCGGTAVIQDGFGSIKKTHQNIHRKKCNCAFLVPSVIPVLNVQTGDNLDMLFGGLEKLEFCTAPLERKQREELLEKLPGVRIYNSYGATEAARTVYVKIENKERELTAVGRAVKNADICIVDDSHREVGPGETGRLCISGGMVMKGYFQAEELTREVLQGGRFYTSDVGYMDREGYIFLLGRSQDIMNIGGEKVAPSEIEEIAYEVDFVSECACVSIPDPELVRGEVPILYVTVREGMNYSREELNSEFERRLERFKRPWKIFSIDRIPRNDLGKMDRNAMRKMARSECSDRDIQ